MAYKNNLKGCFTMVSLEEVETKCNKKSCKEERRIYTLSNNEGKDYKNLSDIDFEDLKEYLEQNYLNNNEINKGNLVSDLATLKTYRDDLQLRIKHIEILINSLPIFVSLISLVISEKVVSACIKYILMYAALAFAGLGLAIFKIWNKKSQTPYKIKNMNNAIYILEEIKDNLRDKDEITDQEEQKEEAQSSETEDSIEITKPENISVNTNNDNAIENETIKVEIIDYRNKSNNNFIKGASCMAVLLLSIAKLFGKKK